MTPDWFSALVSIAALIVTIIGWSTTYIKQKELEGLKGEIQQILSEHDTRFAYLHKRRGEVLDELYKKIDLTYRLFGASARSGRFNFDSSPKDQQEEASKYFWELFEYYHQNHIYLDQDLCAQIDRFFNVVFKINSNLGIAYEIEPLRDLSNPEILEQYSNLIKEARQWIIDELPPIRDLIEKKMRTILGV
jgi:hypothetical protein